VEALFTRRSGLFGKVESLISAAVEGGVSVAWKTKVSLARPGLLLLAAAMLANAGCLAVAVGGAAGAGAATYVYFKGKVSQEYPSTFTDAWQATQTALKELSLPVISQENTATTGEITSKTSDDSAITVDLNVDPSRVPGEGSVTRITVRVGVFGDQALSERILSQVGTHLVPAGLLPRPSPPGQAPKAASLGPITPASWTKPSETVPPPELPREPVPVGNR
jgi:hypothetical protein